VDTASSAATAVSRIPVTSVQPSLEGTIETWPGVPEGGYSRVLLKLSGEAFAGGAALGVDPDVVQAIAKKEENANAMFWAWQKSIMPRVLNGL